MGKPVQMQETYQEKQIMQGAVGALGGDRQVYHGCGRWAAVPGVSPQTACKGPEVGSWPPAPTTHLCRSQ